MKKYTLMIFLLMFIPLGTSANQKTPCWLDNDNGSFSTSYVKIFRALLIPDDLENPISSALKHHQIGDFRFIAVKGYGLEFPGADKTYVCTYGWRVISGTGDAHSSREDYIKSNKIKAYAKEYNREMYKLIID